VGKVPGARYHWHCIRAEAETVSPKAPDDGGPAYPQPNHVIDTDRGREEARGWMQDSSMSLRDWFAGQALNGLLSHVVGVKKGTPTAYARRAYDYADAMLAARKEKP
jgi:hypothetical protein